MDLDLIDLLLRGRNTQNQIFFLGMEGYMVLTVGVGDPGGDGESKMHWLR